MQQSQIHGSYQQQLAHTSSRLKLSSFKGKSWQSFGEALASESSEFFQKLKKFWLRLRGDDNLKLFAS